MSTWGSCDFRELEELQKKIEALEDERRAFVKAATKEIAARLLAKVKKRTPVGVYPAESGKMGGTLRRKWSMSQIEDHGTYFEIRVINPTEYASYVEYGHRQEPGRFVQALGKRLKKAWVDGQFFLTKSELEIEQNAPRIIERKLTKFLKDKLGK